MFSYDKLWKKLIDKKLKKIQFAEQANISKTTMSKMSKDKYVDMATLDKVCNFFNCDLYEIVEHIPDKK